MHTYIKNNIAGNYIETEDDLSVLDGYSENVGTTWEDFIFGKYVELNDNQIAFKESHTDASVQEVFEMEKNSPVVSLGAARDTKIAEIIDYDSSDNVNLFYVGNDPIWFDKNTRAGLKLRFEAEIAMGRTITTLWYGTTCYTFSIELAIQMLYALEVYASACYDNTQLHIANVSKLETIEEVETYDYTIGYPEKLRFAYNA